MPIDDWIKLNVGGQIFLTTRSTLTSCPDSLLSKMFNPESGIAPAYSEDGIYFLDADPIYFNIILNWMRHRDLLVDQGVDIDNVAKIADYFGLADLCQMIRMKKLQEMNELKPFLDQSNGKVIQWPGKKKKPIQSLLLAWIAVNSVGEEKESEVVVTRRMEEFSPGLMVDGWTAPGLRRDLVCRRLICREGAPTVYWINEEEVNRVVDSGGN